MANTFLSTSKAFFASLTPGVGTWGVSAVATAHFFKFKLTSGATSVYLNDDAMDAGTTPATMQNVWTSWGAAGQTYLQQSWLNDAIVTALTWANYFNAGINIITALRQSMEHATDFAVDVVNASSVWMSGSQQFVQIETWTFKSLSSVYYESLLTAGANYPGSNVSIKQFQLPSPAVAGPIANFATVQGNWGRLGMVYPNVGANTDQLKITAPGVACSEQITQGAYLSSVPLQVSWLLGPFGAYAVCPESHCILYLTAAEEE